MPQEELLKRALQLTLRHPVLWLLTLLAGEGAGGGSFSSSGGGSVRFQQPVGTHPAPRQLAAIVEWLVANWPLLIVVAAVTLVITIVVSCLAAAALYRAQVALDSGAGFGLGDAWAAARNSFWRLLGLRVISTVVLGSPYLLLSGLTLFMYTAGGPSALGLALLIDFSFLVFLGILALLAWPILTLTARSVVLEGHRPVAALRATVGLVGRRPGRVGLTVAFAIGLGIAGGVVFSLVDTVVTLPFASTLFDAVRSLDLERIWTAALPLLAVLVPISLLLGTVAGCFYSAYWTLSFRSLDIDPVPARPAWMS